MKRFDSWGRVPASTPAHVETLGPDLAALPETAPMLAEDQLPPHLRQAPEDPEPVTWRALVAARPHVRPRLHSAMARITQRTSGSMS